LGYTLTFQKSAAGVGQLSWTVEKDCILTGSRSNSVYCLSYDINDTTTNATTPTANLVGSQKMIVFSTTSVSTVLPDIPVTAGEIIYVNFSGSQTIQLSCQETTAQLLAGEK
jgi:hypothetical protein